MDARDRRFCWVALLAAAAPLLAAVALVLRLRDTPWWFVALPVFLFGWLLSTAVLGRALAGWTERDDRG